MSLKDYITGKRVEYACTLLETTDHTVENIALLVGYSEKKQFYRVFKEKPDILPECTGNKTGIRFKKCNDKEK